MKGYLALFLLAAIWGISYPLVSFTLEYITPIQLLVLRFAIVSILLLPFIKQIGFSLGSLELAFWIGLSYLTQTIGLKTLDPTASAFISSLYVLFVPLLTFLIIRKNWQLLIPGIIALFAMTLVSGYPTQWDYDAWITLLMPITFSVYIIRTQHYLPTLNFKAIAYGQTLYLGLLAIPFFTQSTIHSVPWLSIVLLVAITLIAPVLQTFGQRYVPKASAAIILAMEPIFAALFSLQYTWPIFFASITFLFAIWLNNILEENIAINPKQQLKEPITEKHH